MYVTEKNKLSAIDSNLNLGHAPYHQSLSSMLTCMHAVNLYYDIAMSMLTARLHIWTVLAIEILAYLNSISLYMVASIISYYSY